MKLYDINGVDSGQLQRYKSITERQLDRMKFFIKKIDIFLKSLTKWSLSLSAITIPTSTIGKITFAIAMPI